MQVETTLRFHLTHQNGLYQENKQQQMLAKIQEKRNTYSTLLVGV
jgi:hypothetical protein